MFRSSIRLILFCLPLILCGTPAGWGDDPPLAIDSDPQMPAHDSPSVKPEDEHGSTVIIRPATKIQGKAGQCEFKLEPLANSVQQHFRVKLSIPESVKIIELVPQQEESRNRRTRIFVEQEPQDSGFPDSLAASDRVAQNSAAVIGFRINPYFSNPDLTPTNLAQQNSFYHRSPISNDFDPAAFQVSSKADAKFDDSNPFQSVLYPKPKISKDHPVLASIMGPRSLETGLEAEFEIVLANQSNLEFSNVLVQLQLPEGLEPHRLAEAAIWDESRRSLSWEMKRLPSGQTKIIRYNIRSDLPGLQLQKVVVAAEGLVRGEGKIETIITAPFVPSKSAPTDRHASKQFAR